MLSQKHRLRDSARINQVKQQGASWHNYWLVLIKEPGQQGASRFAVSASRRIGNAVTRNRIKRLVREVLRRQLPRVLDGWDVVLIARYPARQAKYQQIEQAVVGLLVKSQLLSKSLPSDPIYGVS